ncbi:MAG: histidine kinase, partial [Synergistales bacterium]|nr:histidine kinase [Synergistales bacterium]
LPFLKQAAELADGKLALASEPGRGTRLYVCFRADHIDCPPVGDMPLAVATLLAGHPGVRWRFAFGVGQAWFHLDSAEILEILEDPQLLRTPPVSRWLREHLEEGLRELQSGGDTGAQNFES